jgi:hypothetical protein
MLHCHGHAYELLRSTVCKLPSLSLPKFIILVMLQQCRFFMLLATSLQFSRSSARHLLQWFFSVGFNSQ